MVRRGRGDGRGDNGRKIVKRRGGGEKNRSINTKKRLEEEKLYRIVDEVYSRRNVVIGRVKELGGQESKELMLRLTKNQRVGDIVRRVEVGEVKEGDEVKVKNLRTGDIICDIKGKYGRSGGSYGKIKSIGERKVIITLKSKKEIVIDKEEYVRKGVMSLKTKYTGVKQAGRQRRLGIRPRVSKNAKNAHDRN